MNEIKLAKTFERISKELDDVNKIIEQLVPHAIVKNTTSFGNSSHVVLPKSFADKRVGVIILAEEQKRG